MKPLPAAFSAFVVGCVLWWLGVQLQGTLAALSWPGFIVELSRRSNLLAICLWQLAVHFIPMALLVGVAGYALFRAVGASTAALLAALLPYVLIGWAMGSFEMLRHWSHPSLVGFDLIALSAFPLGLFVAWLLVRRGHLFPPSSGQSPAGFAV
jgi:hypothetical protein